MKIFSIFAIIVLVLILIAVVVPHPKPDYATSDQLSNATAPSPTPVEETTPPISVPTALPVQAAIIVSQPQPNTVLENPFTVSGQARVFENTISYRLTDATGQVLTERTITYTALDTGQFGQFSEDITYPSSQTTTGKLEVFSISPKDGTEINKVTIPVVFRASSTR